MKQDGDIDYVLGHSEQELERIRVQARRYAPLTRQVFQAAGIAPGMHVLDVGSGPGDVAFIAAELVGAGGTVIGTDREAKVVALARARAGSGGLGNVTFREGDPTRMAFDRPFDAIVGRMVLMHSGDPVAMLRRLTVHLRPGGIVAFIEPAWSFARAQPPVPLYERCLRWVVQALQSVGVDADMGINLHSAFIAAGLPAPAMQMDPAIGGPATSMEWLRNLAGIVNSMQAEIIRLGLATAADVDGATLADRLHAEAAARDSVIVSPGMVGAWARAPMA